MQFERLGPYKIGKRIGRGGMGAVFEAVNVESGEPAAIKVLNPHLADDEGFRERFETEIETLKKLKHPNIVRMFGYGEQEGHLYYAMELVRGSNVEDELHKGRKFSWREVVQYATKLCKALKHAHDHGVIHRDLKPANLLLAADGDIKLTDFGIARLFGNTRLTLEGGLVGTAEFMSPEQAAGERITPKSDLYSLGSVMFAMLAGRPPFRAGALTEMLHKQRFEQAPPVSRYVRGVPVELEEVITRLLSKDVDARAPNALILSRELAALEHGLSAVRNRPAPAPPERSTDGATPSARTVSDKPDPVKPSHPLGPTVAAESLSEPLRSVPPEHTIAYTGSEPPAVEDRTLEDPVPASGESRMSFAFQSPQAPSTPNTIVESRFTTVEEDQRRREELQRQAEGAPAYAQIALLALALVGVIGLLWYFTRPPSAEKLFARITAAAQDEDPTTLLTVQDDVRDFLQRFPEHERADEVKRYQEEIALQRLEQRFRYRARLMAHDNLSPAERDYMEAMNSVTTDPQRTRSMLEAMITLYSAQPDPSGETAKCVELAKRQLQRLSEQTSQSVPAYLAVIDESLRRAEALREKSPQEAREIWQSIVELYGEKRWAADRVAQAKEALQKSELQKAAPQMNTDELR